MPNKQQQQASEIDRNHLEGGKRQQEADRSHDSRHEDAGVGKLEVKTDHPGEHQNVHDVRVGELIEDARAQTHLEAVHCCVRNF